MTRREKWEQLPLQAQFYPMPAMAYIEDSATRITLATKQPLGVASLSSGQLEVCNLRRTLSIQIHFVLFCFFFRMKIRFR